MIKMIQKRDGRRTAYSKQKIADAILSAARSVHEEELVTQDIAMELANNIDLLLENLMEVDKKKVPTVEQIQDFVEQVLIEAGYVKVAKEYILYRAERNRVRVGKTELINLMNSITFSDASSSDMKRENANIDADTAMGTMLKYGSEASKLFADLCLLDREAAEAHKSGDIHIHDLDFYSLTETCCQIELDKLFKGGFSTGHGYLREPESIGSYGSLTAIALQCNQNEMHGGQSIPALDYYLVPGVAKSYISQICRVLDNRFDIDADELEDLKVILRVGAKKCNYHVLTPEFNEIATDFMLRFPIGVQDIDIVLAKARKAVERDTQQAMEALVHNLNSMHSRAGAQVPFTSINTGTDTTEEGRMVTRNLLLAMEAGLGAGETAIFPIVIFKVKEGINYNPGDPNYDLFQLSIRVSAKRLFPTYVFLDATFNSVYYKGTVETEITAMGCRTRVVGNNYDPTREVVTGRGNLSFTSINLPRIAIESKKNINKFYSILTEKMLLVKRQLLKRFELQCSKHVYNYPFLMGQGIWLDSDKLSSNDQLYDVLPHGSLSLGFIGLAESLVALTGKHHGESDDAQTLGLEIVKFMRDLIDGWNKEWYVNPRGKKMHLNFSLLATPAEGLSGNFLRKDVKRFGVIPGVTDKDYYTNSSHVPVGFDIGFVDKIKREAPYHVYENAGHICYIEFDGDATQNLDAFEAVIRCMKENNIGYGAVNIPVDRDPVCGYTGIIGDVCPKCERVLDAPISQEEVNEIRKKFGLLTPFNVIASCSEC